MRLWSNNVISCRPVRAIVPGLVVFAGIASVGACSSTPSAAPSFGPDSESAYTKDAAAADAKHDGPSADSSLPDGGAPACGDTSSSPLDCGACGHDCLGSACKSGLCVPKVVASMPEPWQKIRLMTVDGQKVVISAYATLTTSLSESFFAGSTTPGTPFAAIPGPDVEQPGALRISGPILYYLSRTGDLCWRPLAGGAPECITGSGALMDFDVDATRAALGFRTNVQVAAAGQTNTVQLAKPVSGDIGAVALAGNAVLAMLISTPAIYSLPVDGSPGSVVGTAPAAEDHNSCLISTGTHVFGKRYSADIDCTAAGYAIWGGPKAGPMDVIAQGKGEASCPAADADVVAYEVANCSYGDDDEIYSVRHGGKPRLVAKMPNIRQIALAGPYIYFAVDEKVYRVAK